jgi:hypothetical protein
LLLEASPGARYALTWFTRHVRRLHSVPAYGLDPVGWLDRALEVFHQGGFGDCELTGRRRIGDLRISRSSPRTRLTVSSLGTATRHSSIESSPHLQKND